MQKLATLRIAACLLLWDLVGPLFEHVITTMSSTSA